MGGKLAGVERIDKPTYTKYLHEVLTLLDKYRVKYYTIPYYRNKDSFGDIDILLLMDDEFIDPFITKFLNDNKEFVKIGNQASSKNLSTSFKYKNTQVDFLYTTNPEFDRFMLAYNDLGGLISEIAKNNGLVLSLQYGVSVELGRITNTEYRDKYYFDVNLNHQDILKLIDLDYDRWLEGFDTLEEMFNWILESKYCDTSIFQYKNMNSKRRQRAKSRKTYSAFVEYIKDKPKLPVNESLLDTMESNGYHTQYIIDEAIKVKDFEENGHKRRQDRLDKFHSVLKEMNIPENEWNKKLGKLFKDNLLNTDMSKEEVRKVLWQKLK